MEAWFLILISLCICSLLKSIIFDLLLPSRRRTPITNPKLPPGPFYLPIISNLLWLRKSPLDMESMLRNFHIKYGPIVTLRIGSRPSIFIADRSIAHKALVQNGALFADRPPALATNKIISSNQHIISSAYHGSIWRLLRRNLTSEILHPTRIKSYSRARKWVLDILINRLLSQSQSGTGRTRTAPARPVAVTPIDHFQYSMFALLVLMCFGDKLDENQINEIEDVQRAMFVKSGRFNTINFWPKLTKIFLRKTWKAFLELRSRQEKTLNPLIEARKKAKQERALLAINRGDENGDREEFVVSYVDTLLDLQLTEENRKLTNDEMVSICSEFLNAGTDTTSTALQWIMASLVKYPSVQDKVYAEIKGVMGEDEAGGELKEEDLWKLKYLKCVVLEGLRRHPPAHFVLPHAVKEDTVLENYMIPKNGAVNFMVAEMGWDPKVWEEPMEFKPERFMDGNEFDITGNKEIKMMPFGAGRRICPGFGLAILHLEYFIGNLVWRFEWKKVEEEDDIDLSEKVEFTVGMNKPLKAHITPRC